MTQIIDQTGFIQDPFAGTVPVALADYAGEGALILTVDTDLAELTDLFDTLVLIVIPIAHSADGRVFSVANALRELGYTGHIRASGHVLVDQFRAARVCGIDDIEISTEQAHRNPERQWQAVAFKPGYQSHITA